MQPKVVYSPDYDIHFWGIEKLHPFDTRKYSHAYESLKQQLGDVLVNRTITPQQQISDEDLLLVHTPEYLEKLKSQNYLVQALEFPPLALFPYHVVENHVLKPMRLATEGTVIAAREALTSSIAVNLSGGYHHASADRGEGFTIYSDMSVAVMKLRAEGSLKPDDRVLMIDLDAHQGNGHERVFYHDPSVYIFDMYNAQIYPQDMFARKRINLDVPLMSGCMGDLYLHKLEENLPRAIAEANSPKLAIYIAGTDIYAKDALGGMRLTEEEIFERDRLVFDSLTEARIPWVMLPAGGYSPDSYRFIARSVRYILETW